MTDKLAWFDRAAEGCRARKAALEREQRGDEAIFEQIRLNVYNLFREAYADGREAPAEMEKRLRGITAPWEEALRVARRRGDAVSACIEQIKLAAAADVRREVPYD